ncbi:C6 transcription factor [Penicillium hispanicum]|uniref:C6 transcription factor n=1 Tax=Penicillium hispanicum TaxID=1080232 RepID=UPI002541C4E0|nr:C6 transcription factor [Penicillium hispanicum]KAJ5578232.1 C6 transcription factor [Penicillium hispanicum]
MEHLRRYNVERSCLRCHERKVRCDKGSPCTKCVRLNVPCQYPGPRRVKRRPPKTTVTDVVSRLEQLERSIATLAGSPSTNQPGQTGPSDRESTVTTDRDRETPSSHRLSAGQPAHHGFLVKDGCYIDEPLLSRVLEKEHELQSAIGSPNTNQNVPRKPSPLKVDGIITNPLMVHMDVKALHPPRWQATMLWETFLSRVDPVVKVLHVPSTKPRIFAAINRPESVGADTHCLLFAIFFGATTTLVSDDPGNEGVRAELRRYQQGLELAMYNSSFLDSPTVTSLQAMAIYLTCLRYTNSGRSGFTLRGLTIRAAQSIGLHRDGKHFKLSPLECELRRRIWWVLYTTDARMAEDHGITLTEQEVVGDTQMPSNIDDQFISEKTTEPVPSQPRWTETTFSLIIAEINKMWVPIVRSPGESRDGARTDQLLAQLRETLNEKYLQYADLDIPIHRQGVMVAQVLVSKSEVHMRQKILQLQGARSSSVDHKATEELLAMACRALELGIEMYTDDLMRGFRWLASTYTQFHLLTYILWHLCVYPTGPHVEQAWYGVNRHFELAERDPSWPDPGPKWPMLVQLRAKALRIRQSHAAAAQNEQPALPGGAPAPMPEAVQQNTETALLDIDNWDFNWMEFPDWNYLAQSIAIMGQDGAGQMASGMM